MGRPLALQKQWGIAGNFLEIGVYEGKSAYLGALHLRPDESCILVDINDLAEVKAGIEKLGIAAVCAQGYRSDNPRSMKSIAAYQGTVRWFHIDGDHSGFATAEDLRWQTAICANAASFVFQTTL